MKKVIFILTVLLIMFIAPLPCFAESEGYSDIYKYSGADEISSLLDDSTREFFLSRDIDPTDYNWVNSLKVEDVFSHIFSLFTGSGKTPLRAGLAVLSVILVALAFRAFDIENSTDTAIGFCITLSICALLITGIWGSINAAVSAIKSSSTFMLSFVPIYVGILGVSGAPVTAGASGSLMLLAAEFISSAAAFGITAIMGAYLSVSISSSVSPLLDGSGLAESIKKVGMWAMSLCTTVFLGLIGATTAVNSAADSLSTRTAKYILGTCVPVAGTALSGAVNTVSASLSLLKSSVGIYGVIALCIMLLPILAELLVWRVILNVLSGVCTLFAANETSKLFKAVDSMISFLIGAVFLVAAAFIISLFVTVSLGRSL